LQYFRLAMQSFILPSKLIQNDLLH
jgi:hypothetical protein